MNFFAKFHPIVMVLYFLGAMVMVLLYFDPLLFGILFLSQWLLYAYCKDIVQAMKMLGSSLVIMFVIVSVNCLVNQRGMVLLYQIGEHRITAESVVYGSMMALLLVASIFLFGCYQAMMNSTQIMFLLGKRFPNMALIFSMMLQFVPRMAYHFKQLRKNHSNQMGIISTLIAMSLEEAMLTGKAMQQKGYGNCDGKRTSIYRKDIAKNDVLCMIVLLVLLGASITIYVRSGTCFLTFPYFEYVRNTKSIISYCFYTIYCFFPMGINGIQEVRFYCLRMKI